MRITRIAGFKTSLLPKTAVAAAIAFPILLALGNTTQSRTGTPVQSGGANAPTFEVASIKPTKTSSGNGTFNIGVQFTPDGFDAVNSPVIMLIQAAYGVSNDRISGAENWVLAEGYDIEAKMSPSEADALNKLSPEARNSAQKRMLQALLAERFKLSVHRESKELPVYTLVIAKGGSKLKEATPGDSYANGIKSADGRSLGPDMVAIGAGLIRGQGIPISTLEQALARQLDRPVVDKTGLTGKYDFTLEWTPGQRQSEAIPGTLPDGTPSVTPSEPAVTSLFIAIQEKLGLKLEAKKDSIERIVIDHVERPSKN